MRVERAIQACWLAVGTSCLIIAMAMNIGVGWNESATRLENWINASALVVFKLIGPLVIVSAVLLMSGKTLRSRLCGLLLTLPLFVFTAYSIQSCAVFGAIHPHVVEIERSSKSGDRGIANEVQNDVKKGSKRRPSARTDTSKPYIDIQKSLPRPPASGGVEINRLLLQDAVTISGFLPKEYVLHDGLAKAFLLTIGEMLGFGIWVLRLRRNSFEADPRLLRELAAPGDRVSERGERVPEEQSPLPTKRPSSKYEIDSWPVDVVPKPAFRQRATHSSASKLATQKLTVEAESGAAVEPQTELPEPTHETISKISVSTGEATSQVTRPSSDQPCEPNLLRQTQISSSLDPQRTALSRWLFLIKAIAALQFAAFCGSSTNAEIAMLKLPAVSARQINHAGSRPACLSNTFSGGASPSYADSVIKPVRGQNLIPVSPTDPTSARPWSIPERPWSALVSEAAP